MKSRSRENWTKSSSHLFKSKSDKEFVDSLKSDEKLHERINNYKVL